MDRRNFLAGAATILPGLFPFRNLYKRDVVKPNLRYRRPSIIEQLNDDVLFKKELALHLENKWSHRYGIAEKIFEASENDIISRDTFHRNNLQLVIPADYLDDIDKVRYIFNNWTLGIRYSLKKWPEYNWKYRIRRISRYPSKKELLFKVKIIYFGFNKHRTVV